MKTKILAIMALMVLLVSCDDNSTRSGQDMFTLQLDFDGATMLENGYHYEGWAIVDGDAISTGKFNIDASGNLVDLAGEVIADGEFSLSEDISASSAIVITIEPDGDTDTVPAETHVFAGDVGDNMMASLTIDHGAAIGDDYADAAGNYILATPTDGANNNENSGIWFLNLPTTTFAMDYTDLAELQNGYHYEGWAIVDEVPVSMGKFNVNSSGELVDLQGMVLDNGELSVPGDLSGATAIVLTIEPDGDTDDIPAVTHVLAGDVSGGAASLSAGHSAALGNDFSAAGGSYILATPTDGADNNELSGVWFLDLSSGMPAQGLDLPELPAGWVYEGWAVIDGTPVTTGTFTAAGAGDNNAPYSGITASAPPFPGEDFVMNAPSGLTFPTDLSGATAVISIEPFPDDDADPFQFKPLVGAVPNPAADHVTYALDNNAAAFASGSVTITVQMMSPGLSLATLPAGWVYEGWVVINGTPVTTGTFTALNAADNAAPFSGTSADAPPFPGEDFVMNAPAGLSFPTDLAGATVVISIEPFPDDAAAPFFLKPIVDTIPASAVDHTVYMAGMNAAAFASGTATIK
jgi:hypothetical protein